MKKDKKKKKHIVLKVLLGILLVFVLYVSGSFLVSIISRNKLDMDSIRQSLIVLKDNLNFVDDKKTISYSSNEQNNAIRLSSDYLLIDNEAEDESTNDDYETPFTLKSEKILKNSLTYKTDEKNLVNIDNLYFLIEEADINGYSVYPLVASVDYFINTDEYKINEWYKTTDEYRKEYYNIKEGDTLDEYTFDLYFKIYSENKYIYLCYLEKYEQASQYTVFKFKADEETNSLMVEIAEGLIYLDVFYNVTSYLEFISVDGKIKSYSMGRNHDQSDFIASLKNYDYVFYNAETNMHAGAYYEKVIIDDKTYSSYNETECTDKFTYYAYVTSKYSLVNLNKIFMGTSSFIESDMPIVVSEFGSSYLKNYSPSYYFENASIEGIEACYYAEEYIRTTKGFKEFFNSIDFSLIPDSTYKTYLLNNKDEIIKQVEEYNDQIDQMFSSVLLFDKSRCDELINKRNDYINQVCGNTYEIYIGQENIYTTNAFMSYLEDCEYNLSMSNSSTIIENKEELIATVKDYNDRLSQMISSDDFDINSYAQLVLERNYYICSELIFKYNLGNPEFCNLLFTYSTDENYKNAYVTETGLTTKIDFSKRLYNVSGEKITQDDLLNNYDPNKKIYLMTKSHSDSYYNLIINLPTYVDTAISEGRNMSSIYNIQDLTRTLAFTNEEIEDLEKIFKILVENHEN